MVLIKTRANQQTIDCLLARFAALENPYSFDGCNCNADYAAPPRFYIVCRREHQAFDIDRTPAPAEKRNYEVNTTSPQKLEHLAAPEEEWRDQVAARLAAHRQKKQRYQDAQPTLPIEGLQPAKEKQRSVAAAVADRFARQQSYREFLEAQADAALEKANAEAEIAAKNAAAIAVAKQNLLEDLDQWSAPAGEPEFVLTSESVLEIPVLDSLPMAAVSVPLVEQYEEELAEPEEIHPVEPISALSANLIEFPRQLVAAKKARPRLAEGPLREDAPEAPQLRIFEVEAEQIATTPEPETHTTPEWNSIRLDAHGDRAFVNHVAPEISFALPPKVAPMQLRVMSGLVDNLIVLGSFGLFACVFAVTAKTVVLDRSLIFWAVGVLLSMLVVYRMLFFSLGDQTPGMKYARIGLCSFSDENPTRKQMRRRMWAIALSMAPLGLGYLWALVDDDRMGWHDRISRMYMRAY